MSEVKADVRRRTRARRYSVTNFNCLDWTVNDFAEKIKGLVFLVGQKETSPTNNKVCPNYLRCYTI